uniref:RRM domain-containing protein n=1 Tax=Ditylenchus dipsaci TaxID=166011 RepID=A0A915E884_9BILA
MPSALEDANALFGFAHTTYDAGEDIGNKPCTVLAYRMSDTVTEAMLRFAFGTLDIETRSISVHQSDVDKFAFVCLSSTKEAREVLKCSGKNIHDEYGADHGEIKFKILRFASRNIPPSKTVHLAGLPTTATKTEVVSWLASLGVHAASLANRISGDGFRTLWLTFAKKVDAGYAANVLDGESYDGSLVHASFAYQDTKNVK